MSTNINIIKNIKCLLLIDAKNNVNFINKTKLLATKNYESIIEIISGILIKARWEESANANAFGVQHWTFDRHRWMAEMVRISSLLVFYIGETIAPG